MRRIAGRLRLYGLFVSSLLVTVGLLYTVNLGAVHPQPSIIVLAGMESVGADHVGPCYGYSRNTTPNLCRIAEDSVLFEQAYAQGTATPKSMPSMFTARTPREVGITWYSHTVFSNNITTFPEVLRHHGYPVERTYPDRNEPALMEEARLLQGFSPRRPIKELYGASDGKPPFWFFYAPDTHYPYTPDDRFRLWDNLSLSKTDLRARQSTWHIFAQTISSQELQNIYDAEIRQIDDEYVGNWVDQLQEKGLYEDALIILFADHGQSFGQHGKTTGHDDIPFEELVRVPLIIKFPGNRFAGLRVSEPVRLVDVPHTIFDYVGIDEDFGSVGGSLLPVIGRAVDGFNLFQFRRSERDYPVFAARDPTYAWMVRRGNYTYLLASAFDVCELGRSPHEMESPDPDRPGGHGPWIEQLYYLGTDPAQQHDINEDHPDIVQQLRIQLCMVYNAGERDPNDFRSDPLSDRLQQYLQELGPPYVPPE